MKDVVFSIDPSSTATGWALLDLAGRIIQGGIIKPPKLHIEPQYRIVSMADDLQQLLNEFEPHTMVIEITSGKTSKRHGSGAGAGLGVYGMAVGYLWAVCENYRRQLPAEQQGQTEVIPVKENLWCRGISKADRIAAVAAEFPQYDASQDPGGDLADSVSLGQWYLREYRAKLVEAQV